MLNFFDKLFGGFRRYKITHVAAAATVRGARWDGADLSGRELRNLRLFDCVLKNCIFDGGDFSGLRAWGTRFENCSFQRANLRGAVLGPPYDGKRNEFFDVDFSSADMRGTSYTCALFERCTFDHARLERIDFQSSAFVQCTFAGKLDDVLFYRSTMKAEAFPPNEMIDVDFSRAQLRAVGFRGLTLDRVILPSGPDHLVLTDVANSLRSLDQALSVQTDTTAKRLAALLKIGREWLPSDRAQWMINMDDVAETAGQEGVRRLRELVAGLCRT